MQPTSKQESSYKLSTVDPQQSRLLPYYSRILTADQMKLYLEYFTKPLPTTFRVAKGYRSDDFSRAFSAIFGKMFASLATFSPDDEEVTRRNEADAHTIDFSTYEAPHELSWLPGTWQLSVPKIQLRKNALLSSMHKFIVLQHEAGFIVRQEAVSMIPPLFLQAQPGDKILDMCAAPGSKTLQLVEAVGEHGLLLANDVELKRCYVLVHNTITSATPALAVTNCDAARYPALPGGMQFDRVLADVPCSGDGTLRKSPDIWKKWAPTGPMSLHPIQLKILLRGLQLLKVGGRIVYSTCSLNPVEDEAVVRAALVLCKGALRVADVGGELPGLRRDSGLTSWDVVDPATNEAVSAVQDAHVSSKSLIHPTMFSSFHQGADDGTIEEQLRLTMRFYPWLQNTGGFYVCVFEKVAELPIDGVFCDIQLDADRYIRETVRITAAPHEANTKKPPRGIPVPMWQDMPLIPIRDKSALLQLVKEYGIDEATVFGSRIAQRQQEATGKYTMLSEALGYVLLQTHTYKYTQTAQTAQGAPQEEQALSYQSVLRCVIAGCCCAQRQTGNGAFKVDDNVNIWRIPQASASFLLKKATRRVLPPMPLSIFLALLRAGLDTTVTVEQGLSFAVLSEIDAAYIALVKELPFKGQCFVTVQAEESDAQGLLKDLAISGWLGVGSICLHFQRRAKACLYQLLTGRTDFVLAETKTTRKKQKRREARRSAREQNEETGDPDSGICPSPEDAE